jgi:phage terminase large subunit-like protein
LTTSPAAAADLRALLPTLGLEARAELFAGLDAHQLELVRCDWPLWARREQLPPAGDWSTWLVLAGRGWGKTRTGAEWIRSKASELPGCRLALVARTAADARDVMVEGESGVLAVSPAGERPDFEPSKRRLTWPNGSMATLYSAEEADLLRGPQHHAAWCDELAAWSTAAETWSNLVLGLRLGAHPRALVTTTPRPIPLVRELLSSSSTVTTRGSTYDNAANLPASSLREFRARYEGTRLGRQELEGQLLDDVPGALWTRAMLDDHRVKAAPELVRVVVAIDPAASSGPDADETGIVAVGRSREGHLYVLRDASCRASPDGWARRAVACLDELEGDRLVAEKNQGGEMVESVIRTVRASVPLKLVHASRGKVTRAEPIAALAEQGRLHLVGTFDALEDQLCTYSPESSAKSPDRMDALVWACTELAGSGVATFGNIDKDTEQRLKAAFGRRRW